jgi:hypothetical protein
MDEIKKQHSKHEQNKKTLYKKVLNSIRQKCIMFSKNNIPYLIHTFDIINLNGLPLMKSCYTLKRYCVKKLIKEGFIVHDLSDLTTHRIKIEWN